MSVTHDYISENNKKKHYVRMDNKCYIGDLYSIRWWESKLYYGSIIRSQQQSSSPFAGDGLQSGVTCALSWERH